VIPVAVFPPDARIDLLSAYAPTTNEGVVSVQFPDPTVGFPKADLWVIDLEGKNTPRQLTFAPALLKTDAVWSKSGAEVFFIGSQFDNERNGLRGRIYSVPIEGERDITLRFESAIFSPATILWQYE
jgi:hypothetical protein